MANFRSIHTTYGLQRMAAAEAAGAAINITEIAVGDGNGNPINVDDRADASGLVRERFRGPVNRVYQDPERQNKYTAELVIPASAAGFTLREIGIFDDQGGMFAVGNLPETYKPQLAEGAFADTVVRFEFLVTNASIVTLQVDPNVAVATQTWIINNVTMATLLPGGTTGQIATKASNADGDIIWADPDAQNVTVNTIEEKQQLVDGQTVVTLAVCTTRGLAVYVDGERVPNDEWTAHPTNPVEFSFNAAIIGAHELICAQNEPTGNAPAPLERSKNLQDLENKQTARQNLDVYSRAESDQLCPPGSLDYWPSETAPIGWLKRNGAAVSRIAYSRLFAVIGTRFGAGDGFNTFNLPDDRGEFIRGWDDGRGVDPGRVLGSWQADLFKAHNHQSGGTPGLGQGASGINSVQQSAGTQATSTTGGTETRPRNRAYLPIIKY